MKAARQSGFTLIELVVVITILGILAAFAVPRFAALDQQARIASRSALAGSVRSAAALSHALWLAQGSTVATVTVEGQSVTITAGYPDRLTLGRTISDLNSSGFVYDTATGIFTRTGFAACTITYTGPANANSPPTIAVSANNNC
jgi:MSHA pilin protein MshA